MAVGGEPLNPVVHVLAADPASEGLAGDAWIRHLEDHGKRGVSDLPVLSDVGAGDIQPRGAQVLAEPAGRYLTAKFRSPVVGVLLRVGVDRLVGATVKLPVGLHIAVQSKLSHLDRAGDGLLVDCRHPDTTGVRVEGVHNTYGLQNGHALHRRVFGRVGVAGTHFEMCRPGSR